MVTQPYSEDPKEIMLKEIQNIKQITGDYKRKWFSDNYFDLIVWYEHEREVIAGFQLCYDISNEMRALTWKGTSGYTHQIVDDGESASNHNLTPVCISGGTFEKNVIVDIFKNASVNLESNLVSFIVTKLSQYN